MEQRAMFGAIAIAVDAARALLDAALRLEQAGVWRSSETSRQAVASLARDLQTRMTGRRPTLAQFQVLDALSRIEPSFAEALARPSSSPITPKAFVEDAARLDAQAGTQLAFGVADWIRGLAAAFVLASGEANEEGERRLADLVEELDQATSPLAVPLPSFATAI